LLAFGSLLPLGGRLGDAYGRKTMFIVGLVGFAVASLPAAAAPNIDTTSSPPGPFRVGRRAARAGRAVTDHGDLHRHEGTEQGVRDLRRRRRQQRALGLLLGGLLTDYVNWRWFMYGQHRVRDPGIIGGLALLHTPRPTSPSSPCPDDPRATAIFGVVFGSAKAQTDGWSSPVTLTPRIPALSCSAASVVLRKSTATRSSRTLLGARGAAYLSS